MEKKVLKFIFPAPHLNISYLNEYKDYIIHIPTNRNIKDENINKEINEKIPCIFKKYPNSNNILIIFHCNGIDMFDTFEIISELNLSEKFKINILIPEYPGYTIYDSPLSSEKCLEDSLIIYDYILNNIKNIKEKNIYILGRSLGTGPAIYLSSKRNPAGTILISPYTTFAAVGKHNEEEFKALSNHFTSIDYIDKVTSPIFIIHGKSDELINYQEAIKLYEKCDKNKNKKIEIIKDMGHNNIHEYIDNLIIPYANIFINKYCPLNYSENNKDVIIDFNKNLYELPDKVKEMITNISSDSLSDDS